MTGVVRRPANPRAPGVPRLFAIAGVLFAALAAWPAHAQLSGSSLIVGQVGNWAPTYPDRGPPNRESLYGLVDLRYSGDHGFAGIRYETDRNSDELNEYQGLTQRFADWSGDGVHVRVGNFYTILGRGLVHRSFELPGVLLEKTSYRTRWTPSRDVDGALVELERGPVHARLLSGSPSEGSTSLAEEQQLDRLQHRGHVSGGELALELGRGARAGATYLRSTGGIDNVTLLPRQQEAGSGFVEFDAFSALGSKRASLPVYAEYAQQDQTFSEWWRFDRRDQVPHALYASSALLWGIWGLSAEWKDYGKFDLGTNDPPSLVREHSALLLNRSTHVLVARREEGYQIEGSCAPTQAASILANLSRSDGARGDRFTEAFAELRLRSPADSRWEASAFWDRASDSTVSVIRRDTYGSTLGGRWHKAWSATLEMERQTARRVGFDFLTFSTVEQPYENVYVSLAVSRADYGSLAVSWERTTDPLDLSWDFGRTRPLHFVGWTASAHLSDRNEALAFVGRRRSGLACTAGTCYEVQAFEGAELRLLSRF